MRRRRRQEELEDEAPAAETSCDDVEAAEQLAEQLAGQHRLDVSKMCLCVCVCVS